MKILRFFLLPILAAAVTFKWTRGADLQASLSDFTSTLYNGKVYIAGGCQSSNGHAFYEPLGIFRCDSTTNSFFSYDPATGAIDTSLTNMPRRRHRHAAAISNDRLYILGGRDAGDNFHLSIDVYNFSTKQWKTFGQLTPVQAASDLGAFAHNNAIYMVGGYDASYRAKASVWKVDASGFASETVSISAAPPLKEARAEIRVHYDGAGKAYAVGGYTHENDYCPALSTVESWNAGTGQWSYLSDLTVGRANMALTSLENQLIAVGGESPAESDCQLFFPEPGMNTDVLDSVEILSSNAWTMGAPALARRHRFGDPVVFGSKAYFFGGLDEYRADCECYKTSKEVWILTRDDSTPQPVSGPTSAPSPAPTRAPTSKPTPAPVTNAPTLATNLKPTTATLFGCFAGDTTVEVMNRGTVSMKDLTIGDHVKVAGGKFAQVYSFGHYEQNSKIQYLSIDTGLGKPLLITPEHMVFVNAAKAIPASLVAIGDSLTRADGTTVPVKSITRVVGSGAFAPFTMDGTIVVNDVVASSFVALEPNSPSLLIGGVETLSLHGLAQLFEAPHRLVCALNFAVCSRETYSEGGLSSWIETPLNISQWILRQNGLLKLLFFVPSVIVLAGFVMVEAVVTRPLLLLGAIISAMALMRKAEEKKLKK